MVIGRNPVGVGDVVKPDLSIAWLLVGNWIFRGIGSGRGVYLRVVGIVDFVEVNGEA